MERSKLKLAMNLFYLHFIADEYEDEKSRLYELRQEIMRGVLLDGEDLDDASLKLREFYHNSKQQLGKVIAINRTPETDRLAQAKYERDLEVLKATAARIKAIEKNYPEQGLELLEYRFKRDYWYERDTLSYYIYRKAPYEGSVSPYDSTNIAFATPEVEIGFADKAGEEKFLQLTKNVLKIDITSFARKNLRESRRSWLDYAWKKLAPRDRACSILIQGEEAQKLAEFFEGFTFRHNFASPSPRNKNIHECDLPDSHKNPLVSFEQSPETLPSLGGLSEEVTVQLALMDLCKRRNEFSTLRMVWNHQMDGRYVALSAVMESLLFGRIDRDQAIEALRHYSANNWPGKDRTAEENETILTKEIEIMSGVAMQLVEHDLKYPNSLALLKWRFDQQRDGIDFLGYIHTNNPGRYTYRAAPYEGNVYDNGEFDRSTVQAEVEILFRDAGEKDRFLRLASHALGMNLTPSVEKNIKSKGLAVLIQGEPAEKLHEFFEPFKLKGDYLKPAKRDGNIHAEDIERAAPLKIRAGRKALKELEAKKSHPAATIIR